MVTMSNLENPPVPIFEALFQRKYVDRKKNRDIGRDGKPIGMHVLHDDGSWTRIKRYSFLLEILQYDGVPPNKYKNLSENRDLGRVNLPHGTCVKHNNGVITKILDYEDRGNCSRTFFCRSNSCIFSLLKVLKLLHLIVSTSTLIFD